MSGMAVVVTGASDGIGRELAVALAARGDRVAIAARRAEALEEVRAACESAGGGALVVPTDVGDAAACAELVRRAVEAFGGLDILVNNAGVSAQGRFDALVSLDVLERLMRVNYYGAAYCTHAALPHLKRSRGLVVAVSSLQGKLGFPGSAAYSASKHAMQGFFDSLRIELRRDGVDVLVVSPGPVATAIHRRFVGADGQVVESGPADRTAGMPVDVCAAKILRAIDRRARELVMTPGGKLAVLLRPFLPGFVDRRLERAVERFYEDLEGRKG